MSHSKRTRRDYSLFIEKQYKSAKQYINSCAICGHRGYSPMIEQEDFCTKPVNAVIFKELTKTLNKLELDALGRCADCAMVHDKE